MSNLANTFTENATVNADKTAIFWGDEQHTFGQAHALAGGLAKRLKDEFGLQPGDRVCLLTLRHFAGRWRRGVDQ